MTVLPAPVAVVALAAAALPQVAPAPADEGMIREPIAKYVDARERRDSRGVEALFTPDADQLVSSGECQWKAREM